MEKFTSKNKVNGRKKIYIFFLFVNEKKKKKKKSQTQRLY